MLRTTRRYNARYNEEAIADILMCAMKVLGCIDAISEVHADGDGIDAVTINDLEARVEDFDKAIVKIWTYPLDIEGEVGGD